MKGAGVGLVENDREMQNVEISKDKESSGLQGGEIVEMDRSRIRTVAGGARSDRIRIVRWKRKFRNRLVS